MLGKLTKFEFRAVNKVLLLINGVTLLLTLIGCLTFVSPLWEFDSDYIISLAFSSVIVYYIAIIAVSLFAMIYLAVRFYRNLYTDEGYLMHTLPVTPRELIWSKAITAFCWMLITTLTILFSICAIFFSAYLKFGVEEFQDISELFIFINDMTRELYDMSVSSLCILFIIAMVIGSLQSIFMTYAAISLGQLFNRHKVLSSILCYIGLYFAMQILSSILMVPYWKALFSTGSIDSYMRYTLISTTLMSAVLCVVFYIITERLMTKKLNLD